MIQRWLRCGWRRTMKIRIDEYDEELDDLEEEKDEEKEDEKNWLRLT